MLLYALAEAAADDRIAAELKAALTFSVSGSPPPPYVVVVVVFLMRVYYY